MIKVRKLSHVIGVVVFSTIAVAQAAEVSVGNGYVLATINGQAWGWGNNHRGTLGTGNNTLSQVPVRISGLNEGVQSISAGFGYSRAVQNGALWWWGFSQCSSNNPSEDSWVPTPIAGLQSGVTMVSGDYRRACAIKDGGVWCWGNACTVTQHWNQHVCPEDVCQRPIPLPALQQGVTSISIGTTMSCAIKDGGLWCWNYNPSREPNLFPELAEGVTSVDVSNKHGCAVRNGEVWCWGDTSGNKLGYSIETGWSANPHKVVGLEPRATSVATGIERSCAIVENGDVWCWGYLNGIKSVPTKIEGLPSRALQISLSSHHNPSMPNSCVVLEQGEIWCWGAIISGEDVRPHVYSQPTRVEGLPAEVQTVPVAIDSTSIPNDFRVDGFARIQELEATVAAQNTEIIDLRAMVRMLLGSLGQPIPPEFDAPGAEN